ncbi:MAG: sulfatase-like hydrolase/transferase [SAR324 cluster bacterium]|uniref:Sulfatase-like hydrolase/transferase n=1 Tax=SAR324 cluster bacterium TaxID=2024889 RepID=A0A7X9IJS6_9DELT|nr:sulfatase-like hydrolase/transferase [SAR324 cluster bacterium]
MLNFARFTKSLAGLLSLCFLLFFAFPLLLFSQNADEFNYGFLSLLPEGLLYLLPVVLGLAFFLSFLPERLFSLMSAALLVLIVLVYVQGLFLVWEYGPFNGELIKWSHFKKEEWIDGLIWFFFLSLALFYHQRLRKFYFPLLLFVLVALSMSLASELFTKESKFPNDSEAIKNDSLFSFSNSKNALVIVLDTFVSPAFEEIMKRQAELASIFSGFTYYPNTLAPFSTTAPSIPSLLSGTQYDNSEPIKDYLSRVLPFSSLPSQMHANGYQTDTMTMSVICPRIKGSCHALNKIVARDPGEAKFREYLELMDFTLFRVLPQVLKKKVYNNEKWLLQRVLHKGGSPRSLFNSVRFADVFERRIHTDSAKPTFKFLHLMIPHPPIHFKADCSIIKKEEELTYLKQKKKAFEGQAICSLRLLEKMFSAMKKNGVFDSSLIIVTADHGHALRYLTQREGEVPALMEQAMPLLLLKEAGVNGTEPYKVSNAPAYLIDIPKTVADFFDLSFKFPGESLLSLPETKDRLRYYWSYGWHDEFWKKTYMPKMHGYVVSGNVRDPRSWSQGKSLAPPER